MAEIWCVRGYAHEVEPPIEEDCPMCELEDDAKKLEKRLKRAIQLLREWRDKYGARDTIVFKGGASEGDLAGQTRRFLEGK